MNNITEIAIDVEQAITENGQLQIDGALSVLLHNAGSVTVTINANLTIKAGATMQIAAPAANLIINDNLTVRFPSTSGARLEVVTTRLKRKEFSNYS